MQRRFARISFATMFCLLLNVALSACGSELTQTDRLRSRNNGLYAIHDLVVRFPKDPVVFGDVPAGATTEYVEVPDGVFSYAAYNFIADGKIITQPVIDWVGEKPMDGSLFTCSIEFDPARFATNDGVRLVDVKIDK
jgi:hypothetical protein